MGLVSCLTDLMNLATGLPEEAKFGGGGQAQGKGVFRRWQLGHVKHSSVRLQEDGAQVGHQGTLRQLLQGMDQRSWLHLLLKDRSKPSGKVIEMLGQLMQGNESEVRVTLAPGGLVEAKWHGDCGWPGSCCRADIYDHGGASASMI